MIYAYVRDVRFTWVARVLEDLGLAYEVAFDARLSGLSLQVAEENKVVPDRLYAAARQVGEDVLCPNTGSLHEANPTPLGRLARGFPGPEEFLAGVGPAALEHFRVLQAKAVAERQKSTEKLISNLLERSRQLSIEERMTRFLRVIHLSGTDAESEFRTLWATVVAARPEEDQHGYLDQIERPHLERLFGPPPEVEWSTIVGKINALRKARPLDEGRIG